MLILSDYHSYQRLKMRKTGTVAMTVLSQRVENPLYTSQHLKQNVREEERERTENLRAVQDPDRLLDLSTKFSVTEGCLCLRMNAFVC